ncbi:hypothetical protein, partial [Pseudomonas syringae]|uniref:hypothetical protein n=1 Tax=Pseudomonas syringae TaxID=317 RepID=UPI001C81DF67
LVDRLRRIKYTAGQPHPGIHHRHRAGREITLRQLRLNDALPLKIGQSLFRQPIVNIPARREHFFSLRESARF